MTIPEDQEQVAIFAFVAGWLSGVVSGYFLLMLVHFASNAA